MVEMDKINNCRKEKEKIIYIHCHIYTYIPVTTFTHLYVTCN